VLRHLYQFVSSWSHKKFWPWASAAAILVCRLTGWQSNCHSCQMQYWHYQGIQWNQQISSYTVVWWMDSFQNWKLLIALNINIVNHHHHLLWVNATQINKSNKIYVITYKLVLITNTKWTTVTILYFSIQYNINASYLHTAQNFIPAHQFLCQQNWPKPKWNHCFLNKQYIMSIMLGPNYSFCQRNNNNDRLTALDPGQPG